MSKRENIDPNSVINDFFMYVDQYRKALKYLSSAKDILLPKQQISGLLIELALKTYLCSCEKIAWGHDLKSLADEAISLGLDLRDEDYENVISNTNDIYYRGGAWDSDYICRYPKPNRGTMVTVTPTYKMVDEMVESIVFQAKQKLNA